MHTNDTLHDNDTVSRMYLRTAFLQNYMFAKFKLL